MSKLLLVIALVFYTALLVAQEEAAKGSFQILTSPSSAFVTIDGLPEPEKRTPCMYKDYPAISYRLKIEKHNYLSVDTTITCLAGEDQTYFFELLPKTGMVEIHTIPDGVAIYINDQYLGDSPVIDQPVLCGPNVIKMLMNGREVMNQTYVVDESHKLQLLLDVSSEESTGGNPSYSSPALASPITLEEENYYDEVPLDLPAKKKTGGFGSVGFYTMLGSNGAKGSSFRYGADLYHIARLYGESNAESGITGIGGELVLPLDLDAFGVYGKIGYMGRLFKPEMSSSETVVPFVLGGVGLSIKPSPHFQLFFEFEYSDFAEEAGEDAILDWKETFGSYKKVGIWLGIRGAF